MIHYRLNKEILGQTLATMVGVQLRQIYPLSILGLAQKTLLRTTPEKTPALSRTSRELLKMTSFVYQVMMKMSRVTIDPRRKKNV